jgi:hypothetical protein
VASSRWITYLISLELGGSNSIKNLWPQSSQVRSVRQQGTTLNLDLEDGGTLQIPTAEPTASVMVRDKIHQIEYAD